MVKVKEFPQRHISDVESFRTMMNEVLDYYSVMEKDYEEVKNMLAKTTAGADKLLSDFEALIQKNKDLELELKQKEAKIQELTDKPQEKKTLKRLDKKPLKRIK